MQINKDLLNPSIYPEPTQTIISQIIRREAEADLKLDQYIKSVPQTDDLLRCFNDLEYLCHQKYAKTDTMEPFALIYRPSSLPLEITFEPQTKLSKIFSVCKCASLSNAAWASFIARLSIETEESLCIMGSSIRGNRFESKYTVFKNNQQVLFEQKYQRTYLESGRNQFYEIIDEQDMRQTLDHVTTLGDKCQNLSRQNIYYNIMLSWKSLPKLFKHQKF